VLDLRLYRASLLPFFIAAVVAAFSPVALSGGLTSPLPGDLFSGPGAASTLEHLARAYPHRDPGSPGDDALASYVAVQLRADGFVVRTVASETTTTSGRRTVETVIAQHGGGTPGSVVVVADRDADGTGAGAEASLTPTAALLELASVLAPRGAPRALTLVSTSGGSAGAALAAAAIHRPVDAAIVIGNLAGAKPQAPLEVPWSGDGGAAPLTLQGTVAAALSAQLGVRPGRPGIVDELARFAVPLTVSDQGSFEDAGIAAVLVQQGGEPGTRSAAVSAQTLGAFGRAILSSVLALEHGPAVSPASTRDLTLASNVLGGWIARLLCGLLIAAAGTGAVDLMARSRRRRLELRGWFVWVLTWSLPVFVTILYAKLLAWSGVLAPVPAEPVTTAQLPLRGDDILWLASVAVVFALACLARVRLLRGPTLDDSPAIAAGAPVALLCLASVLAAVVWLANPYTAALLALPLIVWLPVMGADRHRTAAAGALWFLASLVPLGLALGIESGALGLGPVDFAWTWLHVFAGGGIGLGAMLAVSLAGGIALTAAFVLVHSSTRGSREDIPITVRGPATYAGPGSLGGTPSSLR
jgi:hypothetical protein